MRLERIHSFLVLAQKLNFTRASEELYIAQPSLSRNIVLLEEKVGGPLFYRSKQSVSLTPLGREFLPYAKKIKEAYEEAESFINAKKKSLAEMYPEVRIGVGTYQFSEFIPVFISEMAQRMPDSSFSVLDGLQSELVELLQNEEVDVIFTTGHSLRQSVDFDVLSLFNTPLKLVIAASHKLAAREQPVSVREINACKLPVFTLEPTLRPYLARAFPDLKITQFNSLSRCLPLVEAGLGIAIFPEKIQGLSNKLVRYVDIADYPIELEMVAAWKKNRTVPAWWGTFKQNTKEYVCEYFRIKMEEK